jgi:hypothetical protein
LTALRGPDEGPSITQDRVKHATTIPIRRAALPKVLQKCRKDDYSGFDFPAAFDRELADGAVKFQLPHPSKGWNHFSIHASEAVRSLSYIGLPVEGYVP